MFDGKRWVPFDFATFAGCPKMQNSRKTFTLIPMPIYDYNSCDVTFGTHIIILESKSKIKPYPGMSRSLSKQLESLGLKAGYNKNDSCNVFIQTSHNGWSQAYNVPHQIDVIVKSVGEGAIAELDGHTFWKNKELTAYPLLQNQIYPCVLKSRLFYSIALHLFNVCVCTHAFMSACLRLNTILFVVCLYIFLIVYYLLQ